MSSSSPSSSSPPARSRKRTAKAGGLDTPEGWMPKIRIINFDPTRNPADTAIKTHIQPSTDDISSENKSTATNISPPSHGPSDPDPLIAATGEAPEPPPPPPPPPEQQQQQQPPIAAAPSISTSPGTDQSYAAPQTFIFNGTPIHPSDPLYPLLTCAKFCENCNTSETSYWRTDDNGKDHCNPCGLHWTKHHSPRPIDPAVRDNPPNSGKLVNFACQICPTRKHARRRDEYLGVILCNACTDYWKRNNAVRPLIAFAKRPKGDRAREPGMIRQTKKCANCGTGRSSRWMLGPDREDNCSECGLFWMYHKMRRPLGVGVGIDVIGPKREMARGPKIMESGRKRRLGSVNTGSGSDTDMEERNYEEKMGKTYDMREREDREVKMEERERSEMEVEEPEVSDDTPVSLLNLAILARKVQLHFQELSLLNSPLLCRPAITSLLAVIDPLLTELSPLSNKSLSTFTRSSLSKSVLRNLLAHAMAAEADSHSSEKERLRVVMGDSEFGPEEVGENFYTNHIENGTIDAVRGLIDLHKAEVDSECTFPSFTSVLTTAASSTTSSARGEYPGFDECRDKILAFLETMEDTDETEEDTVWSVGLSSLDGVPTISISGQIPHSARDSVVSLAKKYSFPVWFRDEQLDDIDNEHSRGEMDGLSDEMDQYIKDSQGEEAQDVVHTGAGASFVVGM